jgi:hypothetical protein
VTVLAAAVAGVAMFVPATGSPTTAQVPLPTTPADFMVQGTPPGHEDFIDLFLGSHYCGDCHWGYDNWDGNSSETIPPGDNWVTSMMAQSARDPVFHAALAIAEQDAPNSGTFCMRCHAPGPFLGGRAENGFDDFWEWDDYDGIGCNFCHRIVDPVYDTENPTQDIAILDELSALGVLPEHVGNAQFVLHLGDSRRGPYATNNMHASPLYVSPHHEEGNFCGSCHDVSNPTLDDNGDGTYSINPVGEPHDTFNPHDMMPEQTTYSEWLASTFATEGVSFSDNRFGGPDHPTGVMASCQDCHMPKYFGGSCSFAGGSDYPYRPDHALHSFVGPSTWVLEAVKNLYPAEETELTNANVAKALERTQEFMQAASDMDAWQDENDLVVRITNQTGHKLPTGYPEGRRMWLNIRFYDGGTVIEELGAYNNLNGDLETENTKVYEINLGLDEAMAELTGLEPGKSFHLTLNNVVLKDNRIPARGFTNEAYEAFNAAPVAYTYPDGHYWDDSTFAIPAGSDFVISTLYYQQSSKEYMEFLRDTDVTEYKGQIAYDQWVLLGRSTPIQMDSSLIYLDPISIPGDIDGNGLVNIADLLMVIDKWGPCAKCAEDIDGDGTVGIYEILVILENWS